VGGGYIGVELGSAFAKLGAIVTIVEATPGILPLFDDELSRPLARSLSDLGVVVLTETSARGIAPSGDGLLAARADGSLVEVRADTVLVAVGRVPATDGAGLEDLNLERSGRFVRIDDQCRSSMAGVFAIGDLTGEPMLAHRGMAQGQLVAEVIAGRPRVWDSVSVPAVVFTDPEIVSVGLDPSAARACGTDIIVGRFPFAASGRALASDATDGFVRVVARSDNHVLLGIQGVGAAISELSSSFALALEMGARLEDIAATIHAHPTRSEAFQEASAHALGGGIHISAPRAPASQRTTDVA
jgi:dihydrolipoamide dehydrogenase